MRNPSVCRLLIGCAAGIMWLGSTAAAADPELARQAYGMLQKHCAACHHLDLKVKGYDVLDRDSLVKPRPNTHTYIVPGNPDESELFTRLAVTGDMPPDHVKVRPTSEEIDLIKRWIEEGAEFPIWQSRPFVTDEHLLTSMRTHLVNLPSESRRHQRYFSLANVHNDPSFSDGDVRLHRAAFVKLINSLHRTRRIVHPTAIDASRDSRGEGVLYALDLRDVGWSEDAWRETLADYPYGLKWNDSQKRKILDDIEKLIDTLTGDGIPYIRIDWFVATASRPQHYHRLAEIPATVAELETSLGVKSQQDFLQDRLIRAGFSLSGISRQNRLVDRHEGLGYYYRSYDFRKSSGRGVLFRFPLGPKFTGNPFSDLGAFEHDGGEIVFRLPNGLQGYMLIDAAGKRIDEGPIDIVNDPNEFAGSPKVINGLSCIGCHKLGVIEYKDTVAGGFPLSGEARQKVERLFGRDRELQEALETDRAEFVAALEKAIGPYLHIGVDENKPITGFVEPVGRVTKQYDNDVTLAEAAYELGIQDPQTLKANIAGNRRLQEIGLGPLGNQATIPRRMWDTLEEGRASLFHRTVTALGQGIGINPPNIRRASP